MPFSTNLWLSLGWSALLQLDLDADGAVRLRQLLESYAEETTKEDTPRLLVMRQ